MDPQGHRLLDGSDDRRTGRPATAGSGRGGSREPRAALAAPPDVEIWTPIRLPELGTPLRGPRAGGQIGAPRSGGKFGDKS